MRKQIKKENPEIFCACGCGQKRLKYNVDKKGHTRWDRPIRFINGHISQEERERRKLRQLGKNNSFYGHKHTEEYKRNMVSINSKPSIERLGEEKAKKAKEKLIKALTGRICLWARGKTYEEIYGQEKARELREIRREDAKTHVMPEWTDERRKKTSLRKKLDWQDEGYRERTLEKMLKNRYKKPTSFEEKISLLCIKYNLPFYYTGNGTFFVGKKNPDFKHKTKPIVIEVFSNFFKKAVFGSVEDYMKNRELYFSQHGFTVIFIQEEEIMAKNWEEICLEKIRRKS